ncbi:MAG TPA: hypothetical protein VK419_06105 [Bryobacteraceae bacterium]|nr:hypothetical protein [Bryobacteraceae bacterium]
MREFQYAALQYLGYVRALKRVIFFLAAAVAVIYAGDFLSVRFPVPKTRNPYGNVQIQPYYAIGLKNKKTEYDFDVPPETVTCVRSLFPHFGFDPCWYLARHTVKRIEE